MNDSNGYDAARMGYPIYTSPDSSIQFVPMPALNSETEGINGESSDAIAQYVEPTGSASYPYTGLSGIVPYANGNIGGGYNPGAFAVQSGYEGYLVPAPPKPVVEKAIEAKSNNEPSFISSISSTISSLTNSLPFSFRSFALQAFTMLSAVMGATAMGAGLTTAICTFTPLCTISFALPFTRSGLKSLASPFVGEDNVEILDSTLQRLAKMQDKEKVGIAAKTSDNAGSATKAANGADVTADVAATIAKVAKVAKAAAAAEATVATALAEPAPKTIVADISNDK